jgi:hypothetical protein
MSMDATRTTRPAPALSEAIERRPGDAATLLEAANPSEAEAVATCERLVSRWMAPAGDLFVVDEESGYRRFDPQSSSGVDVHGLILGAVGEEFGLVDDDHPLTPEALAEWDVDLGPEHDTFMRAWNAQRAGFALRHALTWLSARAPLASDSRARLAALASLSLPTMEGRLLADLLPPRS